MARYKPYDYKQKKMLVVDFDRQILPGSFEHTLSYLVDNELDLSEFDARFNNDDVGRPAYDPAILLKIILAAYARGVTSSRKIEQLCRENIVFIALSADSQPHFTTIADFVSGMHDLIAPLFMQVLLVCDQAGLIGKEMFAIDGCKLPSNASKDWSGTHAELTKKHKKIDRAVRRMLAKHRDEDRSGATDAAVRAKEAQQIEKLRSISKKIKKHLATATDRIGHRGQPIKSNLTDPDSAKMKTSHGVIQGYVGVAAVDGKHQVIVSAEAFGEGQEQRLYAISRGDSGQLAQRSKVHRRRRLSLRSQRPVLRGPASRRIHRRSGLSGTRSALQRAGSVQACRPIDEAILHSRRFQL